MKEIKRAITYFNDKGEKIRQWEDGRIEIIKTEEELNATKENS